MRVLRGALPACVRASSVEMLHRYRVYSALLCLGLVAGCDSDQSCDGLARVAACGLQPSAATVRTLPAQHQLNDLKLYVDRSGSMAGYLDSTYSGEFGLRSSSLRRVLNRVLATHAGRVQVFGFGDRVTSATTPGHDNQDVIATLVRQGFYNDNNTRL